MTKETEDNHLLQTKGKGYSVWLMPQDLVYSSVDKIIRKLSSGYFNKNLSYQAPYFKPHITLINTTGTEQEILAKTKELASSIKQFDIKFGGLAELDEQYFRCVFIAAEKTEELMSANEKARQIFNRESDPPYMPHMSLIYGFFPKNIREKIISEVKEDNSDIISWEYRVRKLSLYLTTDTTDKWYKLKEFEMKK